MARRGLLDHFADAVEAVIDLAGRTVSWLVLAVVVLVWVQNPLRELRLGGDILANDMGQLAHAAVFMIGAGYAWRWQSLVRVDILFQRVGPRTQAMVNLVGVFLLLLPWLAMVAWVSLPLALAALRIRETFPDTGNPGHFLMKVLLLAFVALVGLQGAAVVARSVAVLRSPPRSEP